MSGPAETQLSRATSQDHDEENQHVSKSKIQVKLENRAQQSVKSGVANSKIKRPASPYHNSSVAFHQKDGGKGFIALNPDEDKKLTEEDDDNHLKSSNLRAQWFLSTNQWQGLMPLHIPVSEPLSDTNNQVNVSDELNDPSEFSSAVSESLKKMKENHSLFYKIACDISISDSDITKNDEQASRPEEEEELVISESESTGDVGTPSDLKSNGSNLPEDENSGKVNDTSQHSTHKRQNKVLFNPTYDGGEKIPEESEDKSEKTLKILHEAGDPNENSDRAPVDSSKSKEKCCLKKKLGDLKEDQEKQEEWKKCASLRKEDNVNEQDQGSKLSVSRSNTTYEGRGLIRSASFGKPRVTVIRTSL